MVLSILAGAAAGVLAAIPFTMVFRSGAIQPLSTNSLILAVFMCALLQIAGQTERRGLSAAAVQITMAVMSLGICLLYAGIVSRNTEAFRQIALAAALTHLTALALVLLQRRFSGNKR